MNPQFRKTFKIVEINRPNDQQKGFLQGWYPAWLDEPLVVEWLGGRLAVEGLNAQEQHVVVVVVVVK